jgi:hypothetical protein
MKSIAQKSTSVGSIEVLVGGKMKNLIEFYSENMANRLHNTTQLLQNFDDAQSRGVAGFIRKKFKKMFKRPITALNFVINEAHIKDLIQAAKHVESSQPMALSTALIVHNNFE